MQDYSDLKSDIKEIDRKVDKLNENVAVYNTLLGEHMRRTANLEVRVQPIEEHVVFLRKLGLLLAKCIGLLGAIASIAKLILWYVGR